MLRLLAVLDRRHDSKHGQANGGTYPCNFSQELVRSLPLLQVDGEFSLGLDGFPIQLIKFPRHRLLLL